MKAKYYLRGMGVGIVVTAMIFLIVSFFYTPDLTKEELIVQAKKLGVEILDDGADEDGTSKKDGASGDDGSDKDGSSGKDESGSDAANADGSANAASDEDATDADGSNKTTVTKNPDGSTTTTNPDGSTTTKNADGTTTTTNADGSDTKTTFTPEDIDVTVAVGETPAILAADLKAKGIINDEKSFVTYLGNNGYAEFLQPGDYTITTGSSFQEIATIVTQNKVDGANANPANANPE